MIFFRRLENSSCPSPRVPYNEVMLNAKTIKKASKIVLECEARLAWGEVECSLRHGIEPRASLSAYVALLERELKARA